LNSSEADVFDVAMWLLFGVSIQIYKNVFDSAVIPQRCPIHLHQETNKSNTIMKEKRQALFNCNLAGFTYYDGPLAWEDLRVGSKLTPVAEDNKYDPDAVALYFGDNKLGFIPRDKNEVVRHLIEMGWEEAIDVRVSRMSREEYPERQVDINVAIIRRPEGQNADNRE
jgi:hypothetical protein